jgi:CHAT domain-containing protein
LKNWNEDRIPAEEDKGLVPKAALQVFLQQRHQEKIQLPKTASTKDTERMIQMMEKEQQAAPMVEIPPLVFDEASHCILFVQANPTENEISWKDEYVAINQKIDKAKGKHDFRLKDCDNADLDDLQDAIEDHAPSILHFCGHGQAEKIDRAGAVTQAGGIVLHNENKNGSEVLSTAAIGRLFREIKADQPQLQIVFLNACHSREQAAAISEAGVFTIGTTKEVVSLAARTFAAGFYRGLVQGTDVLTAIQRGIKRAIVTDEDISELIEAYYGGSRIYPQ